MNKIFLLFMLAFLGSPCWGIDYFHDLENSKVEKERVKEQVKESQKVEVDKATEGKIPSLAESKTLVDKALKSPEYIEHMNQAKAVSKSWKGKYVSKKIDGDMDLVVSEDSDLAVNISVPAGSENNQNLKILSRNILCKPGPKFDEEMKKTNGRIVFYFIDGSDLKQIEYAKINPYMGRVFGGYLRKTREDIKHVKVDLCRTIIFVHNFKTYENFEKIRSMLSGWRRDVAPGSKKLLAKLSVDQFPMIAEISSDDQLRTYRGFWDDEDLLDRSGDLLWDPDDGQDRDRQNQHSHNTSQGKMPGRNKGNAKADAHAEKLQKEWRKWVKDTEDRSNERIAKKKEAQKKDELSSQNGGSKKQSSCPAYASPVGIFSAFSLAAKHENVEYEITEIEFRPAPPPKFVDIIYHVEYFSPQYVVEVTDTPGSTTGWWKISEGKLGVQGAVVTEADRRYLDVHVFETLSQPWADLVVRCGGVYFLGLKDNHESLRGVLVYSSETDPRWRMSMSDFPFAKLTGLISPLRIVFQNAEGLYGTIPTLGGVLPAFIGKWGPLFPRQAISMTMRTHAYSAGQIAARGITMASQTPLHPSDFTARRPGYFIPSDLNLGGMGKDKIKFQMLYPIEQEEATEIGVDYDDIAKEFDEDWNENGLCVYLVWSFQKGTITW